MKRKVYIMIGIFSIFTILSSVFTSSIYGAVDPNYAEALQKALINNWSIYWNFNGSQEITNKWNSENIMNGSNITFSNTPSSSSLPAGGFVKFGFELAYSGVNEIPSIFKVK